MNFNYKMIKRKLFFRIREIIGFIVKLELTVGIRNQTAFSRLQP